MRCILQLPTLWWRASISGQCHALLRCLLRRLLLLLRSLVPHTLLRLLQLLLLLLLAWVSWPGRHRPKLRLLWWRPGCAAALRRHHNALRLSHGPDLLVLGLQGRPGQRSM